MKFLQSHHIIAFSVAFSNAINGASSQPTFATNHMRNVVNASSGNSARRQPHVHIQNGTVIGRSDDSIDTFTAIPFAEPPVGASRLKRPQPIQKSFGTLKLPQVATICPQVKLDSLRNKTGLPEEVIETFKGAALPIQGPQGEDCLTLSITRPAGIGPNAKLPVLFWIFGGGFETGSTSQYDATNIVAKSVKLGSPMVFVDVNYRLGAFGFLNGKELQQDGSTNLGLRDQRLGLEWVAENIAAFGGDPSKVTIWGESAGAYSVYNQLLINNGDNKFKSKPLFRGAIMNSGSIVPAIPVDSKKAQRVYDQVAEVAGCAKAQDSLKCLRSVPYETFLKASNGPPNNLNPRALEQPWAPRPDPKDQFFSTSPDIATEKKLFAKVPVMIGAQEDEGTFFVLQHKRLQTTEDLISDIQSLSLFPRATRQQIAGLVATYPDDPAQGSPFRTGSANEVYPQFKRFAALAGDVAFSLRRREALETLARHVPAWSYQSSSLYGFPILGSHHSGDIMDIFRANNTIGSELANYYISFVSTLNPNGKDRRQWPKWEPNSRRLLNVSQAGLSELIDDFRQESYEYLVKHKHAFAT